MVPSGLYGDLENLQQKIVLYNQVQESLQAGNWAAYGESLEELGESLGRLKAISEE